MNITPNESKHTPGPWRYNAPLMRVQGAGGEYVAQVMFIGCDVNGPLLAAAPDLLAALIDVRDSTDDDADILRRVEAAIAKAEGRA